MMLTASCFFAVRNYFEEIRTDAQNIPSSVSKRQTPPYFSAILFTDCVPRPIPLCFVEISSPVPECFRVPRYSGIPA